MDKSKTYSTGQIKDILGLSRDALRYYEGKEIVIPGQKEQNNYREYDKWDIYTLMIIDFYKKRGLSINEVRELQLGIEIDGLKNLLEKKEKEIEKTIYNQKIILKRIRETIKICNIVEKHLNDYCFKKLPLYEVKKEFSDFTAFEEYRTTLQNMNTAEEDVMTKIMRIVKFDEANILSNSMFIVEKVKAGQKEKDKIYLEYPKCMYTIVEDGRYQNEIDNIMTTIPETSHKWAMEHGVKMVGVAFANTHMIAYHDNKERVFIEIFFPIL